MRNRRRTSVAAAIVVLLLTTAGIPQRSTAQATAIASPTPRDWVSMVYPFVGTLPSRHVSGSGEGATFPGAAYPFGMVQWSPDTDHASLGGYAYDSTRIRGFSLTHLSGTGCVALRDLPIMPLTAPPTRTLAADPLAFASAFSHLDEGAVPGYYRVALDNGVVVQLVAGPHSGLGHIVFPSTAMTPTLTLAAAGDGRAAAAASLHLDGRTGEVTGWIQDRGFCSNSDAHNRLYIALKLDRVPTASSSWERTAITLGAVQADARGGLILSFSAAARAGLTIAVGVSYVSIAGARSNITADNLGSSVVAAVAKVRAAWNTLLNTIEVWDGTPDDITTFYTALYHAFLFPQAADDASGFYRGIDGVVRRTGKRRDGTRRHTYTMLSEWDIYRSEMQLLALVQPVVASDIAQSIVDDGRVLGHLPRWVLGQSDTRTMVGDPAVAILADADALGADDFDHASALALMVHGASDAGGLRPERPGLTSYLARGYVPEGLRGIWGGASTTLEYATADAALARFAQRQGACRIAAAAARRSSSWRVLFNPAVDAVAPRGLGGAFLATTDRSTLGYVEGNRTQYTWMAPHDLAALATLFGSKRRAAAALEADLTTLNAGSNGAGAYLGNEPSGVMPWEFDVLGQPWRTQQTIRRARSELYLPVPDGIPGNDDLGSLSSWYIFAALGYYPLTPGDARFALTSPLFAHSTLARPSGTIAVNVRHASSKSPYIQSVLLDGKPLDRALIRPAAGSTTLTMTVGPRANTTWAASTPAPAARDAACAASTQARRPVIRVQ